MVLPAEVATPLGGPTRMPIIAGPFHVIAGLLLVAGVAKIARPGPMADVSRAAGLPGSRILVRVFALGEIAAAAAGIVVGGPVPAAMVGSMYMAFAAFVLMLRIRDIETAGCGCFGQETEDPPGNLHVTGDAIAVVIAVVAAFTSVPSIATVLAEQPLAGFPYVGFVVAGVWLLMVMLTDLPQLLRLTMETSS